jgi:hypothetical protein
MKSIRLLAHGDFWGHFCAQHSLQQALTLMLACIRMDPSMSNETHAGYQQSRSSSVQVNMDNLELFAQPQASQDVEKVQETLRAAQGLTSRDVHRLCCMLGLLKMDHCRCSPSSIFCSC